MVGTLIKFFSHSKMLSYASANNIFSMSSSSNNAHGTWAHSPENKEIVMVYSISDLEGNQISQTVTWTNVELDGNKLSVNDPAGKIELSRE